MVDDAFDILGVQPGFEISRDAIDGAYLAAAGALHPDLSAGNPDAARQMARVNDAKRLLEREESRAEELLRRLGGPAADQEKTLPPGFLAQMMSVREEVEAGLEEADPGRRTARRKHWENWARGEQEAAIRDIASLFASLEVDAALRAATLRAIRVRLNSWRYIERLMEQLDPDFRPPAGL